MNNETRGIQGATGKEGILVAPTAMTQKWVKVAEITDVPADGGAAVKLGNQQIALFHFSEKDEWFACQNLCPHKQQLVLARGIVGDKSGAPVVACPMHKRSFDLASGKCLDDDSCVSVYSVKAEAGGVWLDAQQLN